MRWVLIFALGAVPWLGLYSSLHKGQRKAAALFVLSWFVVLATGLAFLESLWPGACSRLFPGAQRYAQDMMTWVRTGRGCEGAPSCFVPQHLVHLGGFLGVTFATGGLGGLALGTVLFGWMGAYTGELARAGAEPLAFVVGWHPWAVLRVVGYVLLGIALSEPVVRRDLSTLKENHSWWVGGLLLCIADLLLKWLFAETWRLWLLLPLLV